MPSVPNAFVTFSETLRDLSLSHCLLTPNERLAREYQLAHAEAQRAAGLSAWPTLRCMSFGRFLQTEFSRLQELKLDCPRLLSRNERIGLAQVAAPVNSGALIDTFLQAWQLAVRYEIDMDDAGFAHERGQLFRQWHRAVSKHLNPSVVLEEQLGTLLANAGLEPRMPLVLIDFDVITPPEARYLSSTDIPVQHYSSLDDALRPYHEPASHPSATWRMATPCVKQADNLRSEVAAAAAWARERKLADPDSTIGIVVPTLAQNYDLIQRQIGAVLDPEEGSRSSAFDIAAGKRLADQAIWHSARGLLSCVLGEFDAADITRVAASPFLDLAYLQPVCANWPRHLRKSIRLPELKRSVNDERFDALLALHDGTPQRTTMAAWITHFQSLLDSAGWPQISELGSIQYQAHAAMQDIFSEFAAETEPTNINAGSALQRLDLRLGGQLFAPERQRADIQVLGTLETTGLTFDALWVCGLDESSFPARNLANPFIPRQVANRYGMPRSSQREELTFAKTLLDRWRRSVRDEHLYISYANQGDDSEQMVSPLLRSWVEEPAQVVLETHPFAQRTHDSVEQFFDHSAPAIEPGAVRGGTALLSAQAACPFKAFAQYRLKLRDPLLPGNFPDAMLRGTLLHDAMFRLVRENDTSEALHRLSAQGIRAYAAAAVEALSLPLAPDFVVYEVSRLTTLLVDWLNVEQARAPFRVVALEEAYEISLESLSIRVRIDRMDDVDGCLLVIDYKTGGASIRGLTESPPADTQLPIYSLINEQIQGVYYARVKKDEARLFGAANPQAELQGARLAKLPTSWDEQKQAWRVDLTFLARQFADGNARVAPRDGACDYCHLKHLCRIGEVGGEATGETDA